MSRLAVFAALLVIPLADARADGGIYDDAGRLAAIVEHDTRIPICAEFAMRLRDGTEVQLPRGTTSLPGGAAIDAEAAWLDVATNPVRIGFTGTLRNAGTAELGGTADLVIEIPYPMLEGGSLRQWTYVGDTVVRALPLPAPGASRRKVYEGRTRNLSLVARASAVAVTFGSEQSVRVELHAGELPSWRIHIRVLDGRWPPGEQAQLIFQMTFERFTE